MNAAATGTQDRNQSLSFGNNRVWNGGGNKSFGMLYSSGGGKYLPGSNSGGEATGSTVYEYGYDFDTWMIGYRTNAKSGDSFNQARYNLVWNANTQKYDKVKYTANYTPPAPPTTSTSWPPPKRALPGAPTTVTTLTARPSIPRT